MATPTPFEIPPDLHPDCVPLAFLLGRWEGRGHGDYPTIEPFEFGHEVVFSHNGKPFLYYTSRSWLLDSEGTAVRPLAMETGFWRPQPDGGLEVVLAHPTGVAEVWYGQIDGAKIELATDLVARTATAKEYDAGRRLYGLVDGALLWAFDMAAVGEGMQSHLWGRLERAAPVS
ncbi:FABP family protein [Actinopolymorpha sp. B11F2]|uniref:FABP family protein n=1 Tax=Actinopolymorpha sp. B11F2 TaxID=3160862 RepID=UPI0032E428F5